MFMLVAAEEVRRLFRRPPRTPDAQAPHHHAASARALPGVAEVDIPPGTRYQLLRALRAMSTGECMLVEHRIPDLTCHLRNARLRDEWFNRLRHTESWRDEKDIEPIVVPGTAFPCVIGRILLHCGWCAPSDQPHWVPNLRYFFLTDIGRESFAMAQAWWQELTAIERLRLMLFE